MRTISVTVDVDVDVDRLAVWKPGLGWVELDARALIAAALDDARAEAIAGHRAMGEDPTRGLALTEERLAAAIMGSGWVHSSEPWNAHAAARAILADLGRRSGRLEP